MPILDSLRRVLPHTTPRAALAGDHPCHTLAHDPRAPRRSTKRTIPLAPRHRLPVALVRLLGADCATCRGIGCPACAHTGVW